ncbi:MAG: TatD family hydrolase [Dehalococcoidia bacterium]|nr:TatD family hydrolase [Dehalococcoidia bacterium]
MVTDYDKLYKLIDTHAHLDEIEDLDAVLKEAKASGIFAIVAVGSDRGSNAKTMEISQRYHTCVYSALGLHPCNLTGLGPAQINENLQFIEQNIATAIAIGEIGLDYSKRIIKTAPKELQKDTLRQLLNLAKKYDKPIIIHSRYAWRDSLQLVQDIGVTKAVFHWFTGFSNVLKDIIASGYFISATPATEYHEEHRRAVRETPTNKLLLETDSPVTYGREERYKAQPADVLRSLKATAQLKQVDEATLAIQTTRNAIGFFALNITL